MPPLNTVSRKVLNTKSAALMRRLFSLLRRRRSSSYIEDLPPWVLFIPTSELKGSLIREYDHYDLEGKYLGSYEGEGDEHND